jgi:acetaldehyde dehydrogenase/alcohol dehydrogenase
MGLGEKLMNRCDIKDLDSLRDSIEKVRSAQKIYSTFTQEQVDKIFFAAAKAANEARIPLASLAVEETGMGICEDKIIKNHFAAEYVYNHYRDTKTCGVIECDCSAGIKKIAEPIGVIGAVIPTTNPTSTVIFKILIALKTRNAIIISFHPRAKNSGAKTAELMLDAAVKAGAPENIVAWLNLINLEMTTALMKSVDLILSTGGPGMVKASYSSGKPAVGVGAGNVPALIHTSANVQLTVNSIIHSKTFDNGLICASEQSVIVCEDIYEAVKREFSVRNCYFLSPDEIDRMRKIIIIDGMLNPKIVGQKASVIANMADITVPENTKILIAEVEIYTMDEPFAHEKLSPILAMYKCKSFEDGVKIAECLVEDGGYGHTASIYIDTNQKDLTKEFCKTMKVARVLINTPSSQGAIGDLYNFKLRPSLTLGCGSWGGNSVSENVGVKHLLNIKTVAERRENMLWFRTPGKVYINRGCLPVALDELKGVRKRVFIVTDKYLYKNNYTKVITDKLDEMGITHKTFFDVEPDPSLDSARLGAKEMF